MEYTSAAFYLLWAAILVSVYVGREPAMVTNVTEPAVANNRNASRTGKIYNAAEMEKLQRKASNMFYHGYNNYMEHAFPHDDLKPLSYSYTDSLGELGTDGTCKISDEYQGVAMTLIDSLSTLAVLGNSSEFQKQVRWVTENVSFDVDVQVNVFEANIRLLGGLLSAHLLAADSRLMPGGYNGGLLDLAYSLALRLLPAFLESPTGIPYAWVNLRHGMADSRRITETNVAACGSLLLEMGTLSRLTGNPVFEDAAFRALEGLWAMRSPLNLFGSSLDMERAEWKDASGGVGASSDSFYEYLLKSYIVLGEDAFWVAFQEVYTAALMYYKLGAWYHDSHYASGQPTHIQFAALQAFWPGMQVLAGDVLQAAETFENFMSVWLKFGSLPERYMYLHARLHPTEHYYPLRPELIESNTHLYQATRDQRYLRYGEIFMDDLYTHNWVPGGWASLRSVETHEKEDHMHSYFLAETCKYLFLLYNDTFLKEGNFVFTTEGHPLPVTHGLQRHRTPPHQQQPPGNATLATVHRHPFYACHHAQPAFDGGPSLSWTHDLVLKARLAKSDAAGGSAAESATLAVGGAARVARNSTWRQPTWVGVGEGVATAMEARVCPWYGRTPLTSLCHTLDTFDDHSCRSSEDCGVDAGSCRARVCTSAGFCGTVMRNVQFVPDIPAFLKGQASTKDLKLQIETVSAEEAAATNV